MSDDLSIPNSGYRGNRAGRYGTGQARVKPGMDTDTRRLVMFAGGLGAILVVLIGASALIGRRSSSEIPVVTADTRPIREKPLNPGGMKIDGSENDLFSAGSDNKNAKLAAAAENPDTKALHATATPATPAAPPMAEKPAPATMAAPVPQPAKPAAVALAPAAKPTAVAIAPAAKPAPAKPVATTETRPAIAAPHQPMVQLAALGTEEAAHNEWQQLSKRMPELLNGKQPSYSHTERDGRTFWRVRTTGFADVAQARTFCERVRAKGAGCSVADF